MENILLFAVTKTNISYDTRLRERSWGVLEGRPISEAKQYQISGNDVEGGESVKVFNCRIDEFFSDVTMLQCEQKKISNYEIDYIHTAPSIYN